MADGTEKRKELQPSAWPVIGCRVHPDVKRTITMAAVTMGLNRSEFMIQTLTQEAKRVLDEAA